MKLSPVDDLQMKRIVRVITDTAQPPPGVNDRRLGAVASTFTCSRREAVKLAWAAEYVKELDDLDLMDAVDLSGIRIGIAGVKQVETITRPELHKRDNKQ